MGIKVRSPFVLNYSPSDLRSILSGLEHILAECPDYVREERESEPVLDFMQEISDALQRFGAPDRPTQSLNDFVEFLLNNRKPPTEEEKRERIWEIATPQQRRRLEARGLKPEGLAE